MTGYKSKRAAAQDKLAQPAQEPVAWLEPEWGEKICPEVGYEVTMTDDHPRDLCWIPLYAHPPQGIRNGDTTGRWSGKTENIGSLGMPVNVPVTPPQRTEERNFCPRCGKRTADLNTIHTCTPPQKENT